MKRVAASIDYQKQYTRVMWIYNGNRSYRRLATSCSSSGDVDGVKKIG
jgi:hypothetical protein